MTSGRERSTVASGLTPTEAAAELCVTAATIRRWIQAGELPAVRLGHGERARYRIEPSELVNFIRPAERGDDGDP